MGDITGHIIPPEYEGKCVVEVASANLRILPEFNPIYTAVLYHNIEALEFLLGEATEQYKADVAKFAYPAIFWNDLQVIG